MADRAVPVPRLTITCSSVGADWVLVLRGSLDAGSVVALRSQFDQLASGEFDQVIVDVSDVVVIDHFGAAALGVLGERVAVIGAELRLRHGGGTVSGTGTA
jgi:anti-anti-sigma regulatory factor